MARSDGRRVAWPMPTHRKREEISGDLFAQEKPWRPAREIIDWRIRGRSIFNRPKPLAPKTLARVLAGAIKFRWPAPFIVLLLQEVERSLAYHVRWAFHVRNAKPSRKEQSKRRELVRSLIAWLRRSRADSAEPSAAGGTADPMLVTLRRHGAGSAVANPVPTIAANGTHIGLAQPVVINIKKAALPSSPDAPLPTQTAESSHLSLAEPVIMNGGKGNQAKGVASEPIPTLDTKGGVWLAEPFVLSQASGGAPRGSSDPLPTIVTGGNGAAPALISPYYGSGSGETCASAEDPLPTVTSKGRFGMVVPVTQSSGGPNARDVSQPIPTLTTAKGGEFAVVMPVTHHDGSDRVRDPAMEPLPTVTGANRGELACIVAQFGERDGQSPRVHDIDQPSPTICATGRVNLVQATESYDILFRMLEPHELAAAMGFTTEEHAYEFAGNKTEQIKQIGNAVSVAKMKACVAAIMADAAPKSRASLECREAAE
jgi:DNA (cytosine-5)-methyltransferase 1